MIEIRNSELLQRWLLESGHLGRFWDRPRFLFDGDALERELAGVREQYPSLSADEAEARAALRLLGKEEGRSRAIVSGRRRPWTRRERFFLLAIAALAAALAVLVLAPHAHAQELDRASRQAAISRANVVRILRAASSATEGQGGQPGGLILQLANGGSVLATRPAGLVQFNCSTNLSCSFSGATFTLTATGGSGSGCIPPGSTANALLFDAGSGQCNDAAKFTWTSATNTLALASGGTFDPTAGSMRVPGTNGQLLFNNGGVLAAEDPVVSGPDARGAAQTAKPVAGLAGIDYTTACAGAPCVQEAKVDANGTIYVQPTDGAHAMPMGDASARTIHTTVDNASIAVTGAFFQSTQPVSCASAAACPVNATLQASAGTDIGKLDANQSVNLSQVAGVALVADPCQTAAKSAAPINQAATALATVIAGTASKHTYICSIFLISAAAQNVDVVAGSGTNCGTAIHAGLFGGTASGTGPNLAANTGWTLGNGAAFVAGGNDTAADNICLRSSGTGQISGVITYVQQ